MGENRTAEFIERYLDESEAKFNFVERTINERRGSPDLRADFKNKIEVMRQTEGSDKVLLRSAVLSGSRRQNSGGHGEFHKFNREIAQLRSAVKENSAAQKVNRGMRGQKSGRKPHFYNYVSDFFRNLIA